VELWHASCWLRRDEPTRAPLASQAPIAAPAPARAMRWPVFVGGGTLALAAVLAIRPTKATSASLAAIDIDPAEQVPVRALKTTRDDSPPPVVTDTERYAIPRVNGQPLDEMFPSLVDWTHPVTGTSELMPEQPSRHFGAERVGIERPECGAGHCGV